MDESRFQKYVTTEDGSLVDKTARVPPREELYPLLEEMYGMIWYLAHEVTDLSGVPAEKMVEEARRHHYLGLANSPTKRFDSDFLTQELRRRLSR